MAARKRPRRSNSPLDIVRGIRTLKTIYRTKSKLRKLLPGVFSPGREAYFARALTALREWPELSREQWSTRAAAVIGPHSGARGPTPHLYPHSTYFPWDVSLHLLSHTALLSG